MSKNESTITYEDADKYNNKPSYIIQGCAVCNTNHDYKLKGRTVQCTCGALLVEGSKGKLKRVG